MQQNTHITFITVKTISNQGPSQPGKRNVEKRENILIRSWHLGGVHHILLCLAFVLLYENVCCVWASISFPITTCALVPWEKYVCPKQKKKEVFLYIHLETKSHPLHGTVAFCAESLWQKELCKRAFKIPKWLWSAHNGQKNAALDKGRPLPHHFALQWWIRTDAWTWAGFGAAEAPPRPPLGQAKGTGLGDTLEPHPRASKQSQAANYPRHP